MVHPENTEQRGPFQVNFRKIRHDQFGMQLIKDSITNPDGSQGRQFWINFTKDAVLVFILDKEGNLWMTQEFKYATNRTLPDVPGGSVDEER